ncbi:Flp family type IVb pilin [Rhizobium sp. AAP43]|uniref:Flp family type IVb pilin n=1 Tax=Rhizobium sp. AAP43 TaxID=1523420 RepID=UPI0006B98449|nr:Flp family type IVb pilin [Rhizobium sp. AAP43]KPF42578.1 pilin [Rhizobium sp. AAP43]
MRLFHELIADLKGATAVEYGLIAAIMSVALISGYGAFTNSLTGTLKAVETQITDANAKMAD